MKITIDAYDMKAAFERCNRDYYSIEGCEALLDYYNVIDENMELDAIAICCECSEFGENCALSFDDLIGDYDYLAIESMNNPYEWENLTEDEKTTMIIEELEDCTTVLYASNGNYIVFTF